MDCIYPGSFDPITIGHLDIIERLSQKFDRVIVAILFNPHKMGLFSLSDRQMLIQKACKALSNVSVDSSNGLLVDYMKRHPTAVVARGLRNPIDFQTECQMAQLNHQLDPMVETIFLMTSPEHAHISSSAVREIASFQGDVSPFVPKNIASDVQKIFAKP